MLITTACSAPTSIQEEYDTKYNAIFTLATIPPVLSALDAISSGDETFAIIERGKTYSGIDRLENFYNVGFDPANNLSTGFTDEEFNAMVAKVKELNDTEKKVFFNFYVQDGTALVGAAIAANAGLTKDQFHVYMVEDGTGAYSALYNGYFAGKTVSDSVDEIYDNFCNQVANVQDEFETIMSKNDNTVSDPYCLYNIEKAYALAALDNFTYYIQDETQICEILEGSGNKTSKLASCFDNEKYPSDIEYSLNLKYQKIVDGVAKLTEEQKTDYLNLMYGQYYEDTYNTLIRTERAGKTAPDKKLVFIDTRHSGYPVFASSEVHGIGGLSENDTIPNTYEELDEKYKSPLLFATEEDYVSFINILNDSNNYSSTFTEEAIHKAKISTFNDYIDYIYTLKFTYSIYGNEYDLIMKGHPREVIGGHDEWGDTYVVTCSDGSTHNYNLLMDNALLNFHANDSTGKYIGMVPYGTAAENLAYLGVNLSICGLPSSTYAGYDTSVDVLNIMTETNQDIMGNGEEQAASSVNTRYEAGTLLYTDKNGEKQETVFYNTGNVYKTAIEICEKSGDEESAKMYTTLYKQWVSDVHGNATGIDAQGFAVFE